MSSDVSNECRYANMVQSSKVALDTTWVLNYGRMGVSKVGLYVFYFDINNFDTVKKHTPMSFLNVICLGIARK